MSTVPRSGQSMKRGRRPPVYLKIAAAIAGIVFVALLAGVIWAETPLGPAPAATVALESGDGVTVERTAAGWEFRPAGSTPDVGVVVYPGGHVDARSYAPLARALAKRGYLAVITPMTLNLAVTSPNVGDRARKAHPEIRRWGIVGHSLGGVMAATHVAARPGAYSALIFLAAYPTDGTDLSDSGVSVTSLYGNRDGGLNLAKMQSTRSLLPPGTTYTEIPGANHAQWGAYGPQPGDKSATMDPAIQLEFAVSAVDAALGGAN